MVINKHSQSGFALLMTLIVVGVVISVGLVILDLSIKQVRLSSNARDSEISFHAANAGVECARYWRRIETDNLLLGDDMTGVDNDPSAPGVECFGVDEGNVSRTTGVDAPSYYGDGDVYEYEYEFTWTDDSRCTQVRMLFSATDAVGAGVTTTNMTSEMPGFPELDYDEFHCSAGSQCTLVSVKGYNQRCSTIGRFGTVEREVLLQF